MQRLALVVVPLLLIGCREFNPEWCLNPNNADQPSCEMMPDAPPVDVSCKDDTGCNATPDQPVCKITGNAGVCVECTAEKASKCTDQRLVCTNDRCATCTRHADCTDSNVCRPEGTCALEPEVAYVDGATGVDQDLCSKMMPCKTIEKAATTGRIVKVSGTVTEHTRLDNRNALILGDPGATLSPSMNAVALEIRGNSQVKIFDLVIRHPDDAMPSEGVVVDGRDADLQLTRVSVVANKSDGARVSNGKLTCTRCTIAENAGLGINAVDGKVTISQSTIQKNPRGGILIAANVDEFQIVGNVLFNNGGAAVTTGGIRVSGVNGTSANRINFNSLSRNEAIAGVAPGIHCESLGLQLTARYNIIWNNGPTPVFATQVNAAGCDHASSNIGPEMFGTNAMIEPGFIDENGGNLHLMRSQSQLTVNPGSNDLTGLAARDIDDQPRSAPTDMGADHVARIDPMR
jgi:hypothetical protein